MRWFKDVHDRYIRLTSERQHHFETDHPEMRGQIAKIEETLKEPDIIVRSRVDPSVELFYKRYSETPVSEKFLCVVVKIGNGDASIITAYFTDSIKKGEVLWRRS